MTPCAARRRRRARAGALDGQDQHVAMAEREQVLRRGAGAGLVVDDDRAVLGQVVRVDEHHRQAGAADLADLGVVGGQADGDHAVDGRAADRQRERAVERRDEVELVARGPRRRGRRPR